MLVKRTFKVLCNLFLLVILCTGQASAASKYSFSEVPSSKSPNLHANDLLLAPKPAIVAKQSNLPLPIKGRGLFGNASGASNSEIANLSDVATWGVTSDGFELNQTTAFQTSAAISTAASANAGSGEWKNYGPFGGAVIDLVIPPNDPSRIYAGVQSAGVFVSSDAGATWNILINTTNPERIEISPVDPKVIYVNGDGGFLRTKDRGVSWVTIDYGFDTDGYPNYGSYCHQLSAFPDPIIKGTVYISASPNHLQWDEGCTGGLWKSTNYGDDFLALVGDSAKNIGPIADSDNNITELVFDPAYNGNSNKKILAGTKFGHLYQSMDAGASWTLKKLFSVGPNPAMNRIDRIIYNAGNTWVGLRKINNQTVNPFLYRSSDLSAWSSECAENCSATETNSQILTIASNKIWLPGVNSYTSSDQATLVWGGPLIFSGTPNESWRHLNFSIFTVDPTNPAIVYGGTRQHGIWKSSDGGTNWVEINQGLAGVSSMGMTVSPDTPKEIYSISLTDGLMKSVDGGVHWNHLGIMHNGSSWLNTSLAVDKHDSNVVYSGDNCNPWDKTPGSAKACVQISRDRGSNWNPVILTPPPVNTYAEGEISAIAVDPLIPGRVLAGATFWVTDNGDISRPVGAIYYSLDYGNTWTLSDLDAASAGGIFTISFDTVDSNLVYAGTDRKGLWISNDGGLTWKKNTPPTECLDQDYVPYPETYSVSALVTYPKVANEVFAVQCWSLYRSTDAGVTWKMVNHEHFRGGGDRLLFLQSPDGLALYEGSWSGLEISLDEGETWDLVAGLPEAPNDALAGWEDDKQAVLYSSSIAGMNPAAGVASITTNPLQLTTLRSAMNGRSLKRALERPSKQDDQINPSVLVGGVYGRTQDISKSAAAAKDKFKKLPDTGFAPGVMTSLPVQSAAAAYTKMSGLWLEIPSQKLQAEIVGVPEVNNNWDVSWLGNDAGWLNDTAFPTWNGNSVITAHVTDANGLPGPFANLKNLAYGNKIVVHLYGEKYTYEVHASRMVFPDSTPYAFEHLQDHAYLTLITCQGYNFLTDSYMFRRVVRAVLVSVTAE